MQFNCIENTNVSPTQKQLFYNLRVNPSKHEINADGNTVYYSLSQSADIHIPKISEHCFLRPDFQMLKIVPTTICSNICA